MNTKKRGRGDSDEKASNTNGEIESIEPTGGDIASSFQPTSLQGSQTPSKIEEELHVEALSLSGSDTTSSSVSPSSHISHQKSAFYVPNKSAPKQPIARKISHNEDDFYPDGASGQTTSWDSVPSKFRLSDSDEELSKITSSDNAEKEKFIYIVVRVDSKDSTPWDCYNILGAFPSYEASKFYVEREKDELIRMFGVDQHKRNPYVIRQVPIYKSLDKAPPAMEAESYGRRAPYW